MYIYLYIICIYSFVFHYKFPGTMADTMAEERKTIVGQLETMNAFLAKQVKCAEA